MLQVFFQDCNGGNTDVAHEQTKAANAWSRSYVCGADNKTVPSYWQTEGRSSANVCQDT